MPHREFADKIALMSPESAELGTLAATGFKFVLALLCAAVPAGTVDLVTGGRVTALALPEAGDAERYGIAGICLVGTVAMAFVCRYLYRVAVKAKDQHIQYLEDEVKRLQSELRKERK